MSQILMSSKGALSLEITSSSSETQKTKTQSITITVISYFIFFKKIVLHFSSTCNTLYHLHYFWRGISSQRSTVVFPLCTDDLYFYIHISKKGQLWRPTITWTLLSPSSKSKTFRNNNKYEKLREKKTCPDPDYVIFHCLL